MCRPYCVLCVFAHDSGNGAVGAYTSAHDGGDEEDTCVSEARNALRTWWRKREAHIITHVRVAHRSA